MLILYTISIDVFINFRLYVYELVILLNCYQFILILSTKDVCYLRLSVFLSYFVNAGRAMNLYKETLQFYDAFDS